VSRRTKLQATPARRPIRHLLIPAALAVLILLIYGQTRGFGFISFDDDLYVYANRSVQAGVSPALFTSTDPYYWHPLTMVSHALDWQWYGTDAGGHHLTNVLLHLAASVLLYFALKRLTGAMWRSATVAALFAVHPLHVESVAWVSERKDVLSALFWFATMFAYAWFTERRTARRYLLVVGCFLCALMAKPMAVTLPFALLLLDHWPLGRWNGARSLPLVLEKLPLIAIAAIDGIITYATQIRYGADQLLGDLSFPVRAANAVVAYGTYTVKTFWPHPTSILYPYRRDLPAWEIAASVLLLAAVSLLAMHLRRRAAYFATGWFWFLGVLLPAAGLIQVGYQPSADRFVYIPHVGLFLLMVWGAADVADRMRWSQAVRAGAGVSVVAALAVVAFVQTSYWRDGVTLFQHALDVTRNNCVAHTLLGRELEQRGRVEDAATQYSEALRIDRLYAPAHNNLGSVMAQKGRYLEALAHFDEATRIDPSLASSRYNRAMALLRVGREDEALVDLERVFNANIPESYRSAAYSQAGALLIHRGQNRQAGEYLERALQIDPGATSARKNLAVAMYNQGRIDEAIAQMSLVVAAAPGDSDAVNRLAGMRSRAGR
jgi:tetratricopeptide (TPR) repeat protein